MRIWNEWAREDGSLGPIYGYQWRSWPDYQGGHIDQIQQIIDQLHRDPTSRRMIVSAWNVAQIDDMALASISHIELHQAVARRQRHIINLRHIPR